MVRRKKMGLTRGEKRHIHTPNTHDHSCAHKQATDVGADVMISCDMLIWRMAVHWGKLVKSNWTEIRMFARLHVIIHRAWRITFFSNVYCITRLKKLIKQCSRNYRLFDIVQCDNYMATYDFAKKCYLWWVKKKNCWRTLFELAISFWEFIEYGFVNSLMKNIFYWLDGAARRAISSASLIFTRYIRHCIRFDLKNFCFSV